MRDSPCNNPEGFLSDALLLHESLYVSEKIVSGNREDCFAIFNLSSS